jgi:hypothetical protein
VRLQKLNLSAEVLRTKSVVFLYFLNYVRRELVLVLGVLKPKRLAQQLLVLIPTQVDSLS